MPEPLGRLLDAVRWEVEREPSPYLVSARRFFEDFPWAGSPESGSAPASRRGAVGSAGRDSDPPATPSDDV